MNKIDFKSNVLITKLGLHYALFLSKKLPILNRTDTYHKNLPQILTRYTGMPTINDAGGNGKTDLLYFI